MENNQSQDKQISENAKEHNNEQPKRTPMQKGQFCEHSLVPLYCAHCKFGDSFAELRRNCA